MYSVVSSIRNIGDSFSFSVKDMSGFMYIMESARSFALKKEKEAKERGVNTIIVIDSETI